MQTSENLETLQKTVADYLRRWKSRGKKTTTYECPCCLALIERTCPDEEDVDDSGCWSSLSTCTACGEISFMCIYPDGEVVISDEELDE